MSRPERDQAAAEARELLRGLTGHGDRVIVDTDELNRLIESGVSVDEVREWLRSRIADHVECQHTLDDLEEW